MTILKTAARETKTKLDLVCFNDKFVFGHDFPMYSYTGQIQCLSHSRDQKFVTSLVQSAISPRGLKGAKSENKKNKENNNKKDAVRAFFPTCFLPCTSRSSDRYSRRLACLPIATLN